MNSSLAQRLVGAIVLLVICVVLWPLLFQPADDPAIQLQSQIPEAPPLEVFEIPRQKKPELLEPVLDIQEAARGEVDPDFDTSLPVVEVADLAVAETLVQTAEQSESSEPLAVEDPVLELTVEPNSEVIEETPTVFSPEVNEPVLAEERSEPEQAKPPVQAKEPKSFSVEDTIKPVETKPNAEMWALQAGVFGDQINAERTAARFRELGYSVVVQRRKPNDRELSFVFIGPYFDQEQARTDLLKLESQAVKTLIVTFKP